MAEVPADWSDVYAKYRDQLGKPAIVEVPPQKLLGQICFHHEGGVCFQPVQGECFPITSDMTLEILPGHLRDHYQES